MANAEHIPPPELLRSQRNVMANDRDGAGTAQGNDPNSENDEWAQPMDYWYNRVISKSSPAATTANPSALGLIAFGYTTALLQVNPRMHAHARARMPVSLRQLQGTSRLTRSKCTLLSRPLPSQICASWRSAEISSTFALHAGCKHSLDRGKHSLCDLSICFILWRPCAAVGRDVGVQAQQHVCSHSFVQLRWFLAQLWHLPDSCRWWCHSRVWYRGPANDVEPVGHSDLLLLCVRLQSICASC